MLMSLIFSSSFFTSFILNLNINVKYEKNSLYKLYKNHLVSDLFILSFSSLITLSPSGTAIINVSTSAIA